MNELIQSVLEVFSNTKYNIPEYQRGYKWTQDTVREMLEDIDNFKAPTNDSDKRFYCLQNITITENKKNDPYDVIDGQQRLTTLAILLSYLGKVDLVKDRVQYSIREESYEFLNTYIMIDNPKAHKFYDSNNKQFTTEFLTTLKQYDYQDVFHFIQATYTINEFFHLKEDREQFTDKLLNHVKLIINEVSIDNQEKIFDNLNSNKIYLTDTDLIRAMLITRCATLDNTPKEDINNTFNIVNINEKRVRLGWELDQFHIWWSDANMFALFSKLVNKSTQETQSIQEGIELLYRLYFNKNKPENKSIKEIREDIEKTTIQDIQERFNSISQFHHTMQDWYQDSEIYHYLGFLSFHGTIKIDVLWAEWNKDKQTRAEFKKYLKTKIWETFNKEESLLENISDIDHSWYENNRTTTKILVLLDIISITNIKQNKESRRFPTAYFNKYDNKELGKERSEDLEHIFCQTPKEKEWNVERDGIKLLEFLQNQFPNNEDLKQFDPQNKGYSEYMDLLKKFHILHSIGNLLLLDFHINRSYGNDAYLQKRSRITKEAQQGTYIRPHTWTVFTKTFINKDLDQWTIEDIEKNSLYIKTQIEEFFKDIPKEGEDHE